MRSAARQLRRQPTEAERELWRHLRERKVVGLRFRRQHALERFVLDFYCAEARLAIEVDGGVHDQQGDRDAARTAALEQHGIRVLRFANEQVFRDLPQVLATIASAAAR